MTSQDLYLQRLQELYKLEFFGMKLGLQNILALMRYLGRPDRAFPAIHIAGTNGKGSVASTLAAIYQLAGYRTGLYTSPHLVDFRERIRINGVMMPQEFMIGFAERMWPKVEELQATFFETTTAMAFDYFAKEDADIAIIETGLGGRLDSTNVIEHPLATVITSIGYDHMAHLGNTLEAIAREKAGILKPGVPAVVNVKKDLRYVFEEIAEERNARLLFVEDFEVPFELNSLQPSLAGFHQAENLKTVLATLSVIESAPSDRLTIEEGIRRTSELTGLRARLERLSSRELEERGIKVFLEVGHNADAIAQVVRYFQEARVRPTLVLGVMADKDVRAMVSELRQISDQLIAVHASSHRAMPAEELRSLASEAGFHASLGGSVTVGIKSALEGAQRGDSILLLGSHYVVGEFLTHQRESDPEEQRENHLRNGGVKGI